MPTLARQATSSKIGKPEHTEKGVSKKEARATTTPAIFMIPSQKGKTRTRHYSDVLEEDLVRKSGPDARSRSLREPLGV